MKTTIIATPTQKEWDDLMKYIEVNYPKVRWVDGKTPTKFKSWFVFKDESCIRITDNKILYSYKSSYAFTFPKIPILTIKQFKSMKKTAKKKSPKKEEIIHQFMTTRKTRWQIIKIGKEYMTRHVSPNGNILAINPKQFNRVQNAFNNIRVNAGASLIPLTAKKGTPSYSAESINGYLKCCPK